MKHKLQKHIFLSVLSAGLMATFFISCEKKNIQFGEQFVDNDYTQVIETDTITPSLNTIYIDSFVTSNTGTAMIGNTKDPQFGTLVSSAYFQMGVPTYEQTSTEYTNVRFDSLTIFAKLKSGVWYGDTTQPMKLNVYRLNENIILPDNQTYFYNTTTLSASSQSLGSFSFRFWPNSIDTVNDTLSIRLSDDLGKELLGKLQTGDFDIQTDQQFYQYFKGLKITGDPGTNLSFSINDSIQMRLYYTKADNPVAVEKYVVFPMSDATKQFNNITINRTGLLADQNFGKNNYSIPSSQTGNTAFLNPLGNSMIKITFPTLTRVLQEYYLKVTRATLQIFPAPDSYTSIFGLPKTLNLVTTDLNNGIGTVLTSGTSAQTGSLTYIDPSTTLPYYYYDVTGAITELLADPLTTVNQKGLLLIPPSSTMFNTFNRLIIGDGNNSKAKMKLIIDYISIK
ncbi:MAG: DUF4270 family protein [Arachidicoccus sp.]|nr:DUF4270 family protein [Arachidicoccus sp.]